jgi:hypothetical protein
MLKPVLLTSKDAVPLNENKIGRLREKKNCD